MADDQVPTGPGGLTAAQWHEIGIPIAGPAESEWSADLGTSTTKDLADGHPMKDRSPWPARP